MRNLTDSKDKRQTIHIEEHLIPESRNMGNGHASIDTDALVSGSTTNCRLRLMSKSILKQIMILI
jgi:hypothetical protein